MADEHVACARVAVRASDRLAAELERLICDLPDDLAAAPCAWFNDPDGGWAAEFTVAEAEAADFRAALERHLAGAGPGWSAHIEPLPDVDWVAASQKGLAPVRAGRFIIHGSHDRRRVPSCRYAIEIDAGQAFGTAHHGSTLGCLMALDRLAKQIRPRRSLDLGTGTGVLAIACARCWTAPVLALDTDRRAVAVAQENFRLNGVVRSYWAARSCRAALGTLKGAHTRCRWSQDTRFFDLIVANILAGPLVRLAGALTANLAPAGHLVLSGFLSAQLRPLRAAYRARGLVMTHRIAQGEWVTAVFVRQRRQFRRR